MPEIRTKGVIVDDSVLLKRMETLQRDQIPFALSLSINDLAKDTERVERFEMQTEFDRPTPFILRGVKVIKRAKKRDPSAILSGQGRANEFLSPYAQAVQRVLTPHIEGRARDQRPSERRLAETGFIGRGDYLIGVNNPSVTNTYGNVRPAIYSQMLSFLRAYRGRSRSGRSDIGRLNRALGSQQNTRGWRYFVQKAGAGLAIYRARGKTGAPQMVFYISRQTPRYRRTYDFYGIAEQHARRFGSFFADRAMKRALATAR